MKDRFVNSLAGRLADHWWEAGPEASPYRHRYHESFVYKIYQGDKQSTQKRVHFTFGEALEVIRQVHAFTRGIKQIVYLVGWQFDGHDSKYPCWGQVNERLRDPGDASAREGLVNLIRQAREYNAFVSLHINMNDAYENSPLWRTYRDNELLLRDTDGTLHKGDIWGGEQCYLISFKQEWDKGFARKRIDDLLELLPLEESGTVHIDAFKPIADPYNGISREEAFEAGIEILRYWRSRGIDVTTEWFHHEFAGYTPMVNALNLDEASRLYYPSWVVCGGGTNWNRRRFHNHQEVAWAGSFGAPEGGCLYDEAWGTAFARDVRDFPQVEEHRRHYFELTVPWIFLNQHQVQEHVQTSGCYEVRFSGEVVSTISYDAGAHSITRQGEVLKRGNTYCLPAAWLADTYVAYSTEGGSGTWQLQWETIRVNGGEPQKLKGGLLSLRIPAGEALWITPAKV
jgi:hypothetical protein